MPRTRRADDAGGLYHALNRGNFRSQIFWNDDDYSAFEQILAEGLERFDVSVFSFQLMPDHWHLVLRPYVDGEMSRFLRWVTSTHTMRYHARYHTSGEGHVYQGRYKSFPIQDDEHFLTVCRYVERNSLQAEFVSRAEEWRWGSLWRWMQKPKSNPALLSPWPIPRPRGWIERVNQPLIEQELAAVRSCIQRGAPFGDLAWVESTVKQFGLQSTLRPRGRPRVRKDPAIDGNES